jgi:hypothetical protein
MRQRPAGQSRPAAVVAAVVVVSVVVAIVLTLTSGHEALGLRCPAPSVRRLGAARLLAAVLLTLTSEHETLGLRCPAPPVRRLGAARLLAAVLPTPTKRSPLAAGAPGSPPPRQRPAVASLPRLTLSRWRSKDRSRCWRLPTAASAGPHRDQSPPLPPSAFPPPTSADRACAAISSSSSRKYGPAWGSPPASPLYAGGRAGGWAGNAPKRPGGRSARWPRPRRQDLATLPPKVSRCGPAGRGSRARRARSYAGGRAGGWAGERTEARPGGGGPVDQAGRRLGPLYPPPEVSWCGPEGPGGARRAWASRVFVARKRAGCSRWSHLRLWLVPRRGNPDGRLPQRRGTLRYTIRLTWLGRASLEESCRSERPTLLDVGQIRVAIKRLAKVPPTAR